jgi:hypothetical protein
MVGNGVVVVLFSYREGPYGLEVRDVGRFGPGPRGRPQVGQERGEEDRRPAPTSRSVSSTRTVAVILAVRRADSVDFSLPRRGRYCLVACRAAHADTIMVLRWRCVTSDEFNGRVQLRGAAGTSRFSLAFMEPLIYRDCWFHR